MVAYPECSQRLAAPRMEKLALGCGGDIFHLMESRFSPYGDTLKFDGKDYPVTGGGASDTRSYKDFNPPEQRAAQRTLPFCRPSRSNSDTMPVKVLS